MSDLQKSEPRQQPPGTLTAMRRRPDHGEESYRGSGRLEGKRTIVTGGDSGIGRAVAIAFAREGADVLIAYLSEHDDAEETAKLVEGAGRRAVLVPGDLADRDHCQAVVDRAVTEGHAARSTRPAQGGGAGVRAARLRRGQLHLRRGRPGDRGQTHSLTNHFVPRRPTMPAGSSPKRERQYAHIKDSAKRRGESTKRAKEIAARTVNKDRAQAGESRTASRTSTKDMSASRRGGQRSRSGAQGRTKEQLYNEAKKRNVKGRSSMTKAELQRALS
jgi:hypothetical protein